MLRALLIASAALALSCPAPARAASSVTYVSGKGVDSGSCTPQTNPCRTFAYALTQTISGGEIKALDPDTYDRVTITQSVSITGVEGASINQASPGSQITINAGLSDVVNISNLILDGRKGATNGVTVNSGGTFTMKNCVVRNFANTGISLWPWTPLNFMISDVVVSDNGGTGVVIHAQAGSGAVQGALDHVVAHHTGAGVAVTQDVNSGGPVFVTAVDSTAANNSSDGFFVGGGATLRLTRSTATRNLHGVEVGSGGTAQSAGNNFILGNTNNADVLGALVNVGTK